MYAHKHDIFSKLFSSCGSNKDLYNMNIWKSSNCAYFAVKRFLMEEDTFKIRQRSREVTD
jgi:hypothetical protein